MIMTRKEKQRYLESYKYSQREAEYLDNEILKWRSAAEKITASFSQAPAYGQGGGRIPLAVEKIAELTEMLSEQHAKSVALNKDIRACINTVSDLRLQEILRLRYIYCYKWEEIAVALNYDYRWILRLHDRALEKLTIESHIENVI